MKKIFKLVLLIILLMSKTTYSQIVETEFMDFNESLNIYFSSVLLKSTGELCLTMGNDGSRYLMYIDQNKAPIVSNYNENYCVKDSIKIINKGGLRLVIKKQTDYWDIQESKRTPFTGNLKKYEGGFKIENNTVIKHMNKNEYMLKKGKL